MTAAPQARRTREAAGPDGAGARRLHGAAAQRAAARPAEAGDERQPPVADALRSTVAVNGLPLRVFAAPFKGAARDATVVMAVEVDAAQLGLVEKDGTHVGALEVSYFSIDMKNKFYPGQTQTARLTLKPDTYEQVMKTGIRMLVETTLAPGRYQMRIAAGNRTNQSRQRGVRH